MDSERKSCADCAAKGCNGKGGSRPAFCMTDRLPDGLLEESKRAYVGEEAGILRTAATVEHDGYLRWCRVRETMEFARRMGYTRIGIATCVALLSETRALAEILRGNGFEVFGIGCKAGMVPKTEMGIDPECCEIGPNTCNPIMQAEILNREGTQLNIVMGLCVGHDCLFNRHSEAPVTTLVVKDRVLANNPAGALYASGTFYSSLRRPLDRWIRGGQRPRRFILNIGMTIVIQTLTG